MEQWLKMGKMRFRNCVVYNFASWSTTFLVKMGDYSTIKYRIKDQKG